MRLSRTTSPLARRAVTLCAAAASSTPDFPPTLRRKAAVYLESGSGFPAAKTITLFCWDGTSSACGGRGACRCASACRDTCDGACCDGAYRGGACRGGACRDGACGLPLSARRLQPQGRQGQAKASRRRGHRSIWQHQTPVRRPDSVLKTESCKRPFRMPKRRGWQTPASRGGKHAPR